MSAPFEAGERRPQNDRGDERETLTSYLNFQRDTLRWKTAALSLEQLTVRPVPSTAMTLLGLVRHAVEVESGWGSRVGGSERKHYYLDDPQSDEDWNVAGADQAMVDAAYANWAEAQAMFDAAVAACELGDTFDHHGEAVTVRSLLAHMIEEYARHNGHADLLREAIDGRTGE